MHKVTLGRSGLKVSPIGVGAWELGGEWGGVDASEATTSIHLAWERGINLFDAAPGHGFGSSEQVLAAAMDGDLRDERDDVVITTEGGVRSDGDRLEPDASRDGLRADVDTSLETLGIDVIDLFQVHWPDPNTSLEETVDALAELVDDEKIRHAGIASIDSPAHVVISGEGPLDTVQTTYHMFRRGAEALWLPYAHALDMGVLVDEALADGQLDQPASELEPFGARGWRGRGSYFTPWTLGAHPGPTMMRRPPKGGTSRPAAARPGYGFGRPLRPDRNRTLRRSLAVIARLQEFAAERAISVSELAVAWTLANPMVDVAIVGAGHPRHLDGIIGAGDFRLSHRDLAQIDRILREPT